MNRLIILAFLMCINVICFSQNAYRTINGHAIITTQFNDSLLLAESHNLEIYFDNKSKTILGKINLKSIKSGIPYVDSLMGNSRSTISFLGNIPYDFITWEHMPCKIEVPLVIDINGVTIHTISKIIFTHSNKLSSSVCIMEALFELDLAEHKEMLIPSVGSTLTVQFLQLILRQ